MGRDFAVDCYRQADPCYYEISWIDKQDHTTKRRRSVKKSQRGVTPGNGWVSSLLYFGTKELSISTDDIIWNIPLTQIMLLLRQHIYVNDKKHSGIDLATIEQIDSGEIDRKLMEKYASSATISV